VELIEHGAARLQVDLPAGAAVRLGRFLELLGRWNRAQNLTAVTDPAEMVPRHVLDSLAGLKWVTGDRLLDAGSGAGLPGIPLAVVRPDRRHVLLDSRRKRVQFLIHAAGALGLDNVEVVEARLENYRPEVKFDTLSARAFAALPEAVRLAGPHLAGGARLVLWQGSISARDLAALSKSGNFRYDVQTVRVPGLQARRHILVVEAAGRGPAAG